MESRTDQPPPLPHSANYRFSRSGLVLALLVIAACAAFVVGKSDDKPEKKDASLAPNSILNLSARYAVGVKGLMKMGGSWSPALTEQMLKDMKALKTSEADALRLLLLKSWLDDTLPDEAAWKNAAADNRSLKTDAALFHKLMTSANTIEASELASLDKRHGWLTRLAKVRSLADTDPARQAVVSQGIKTAVVAIVGILVVLVAGAVGIALWLVGIHRWRMGQLRRSLEPRSGTEGGVLIEGFALYLLLFIGLPSVLTLLPVKLPILLHIIAPVTAWLVGMCWPLFRGMRRGTWAQCLGLHYGQGVFREMGAGLVGWLAALPLMALSVFASTAITRYTGDVPSHPIVDYFAGSDWTRFTAVILAVVWAPITEEIMFRGLLFPGLSAKSRWLLGLVLSAFIFAVIHPQGWAGVPPIMTLAATFSVLRLWRQSLIAPVTAHAINNGSVCVVMLLM